MNKHFKQTRYVVQAKRRNSNEEWSEWTSLNNYREAVRHACHAEELGYAANIAVKDRAVEELRGIFGNSFESAEFADAVLNAGFRKQSDTAKEIFRSINECIHAVEKNIDEEMEKAKEEGQTEKMCTLIGDKAVYRQVHSILDVIEKKYTEVKDG